MSPLNFHINILTLGQPEADRILLMKECAELEISFVCENEFGFISDSYPDTPFLSLASLVMLERIQSWLEFDFEAAWALMTSLYGPDDLSFIETQQQFFIRIAKALNDVTPKAND